MHFIHTIKHTYILSYIHTHTVSFEPVLPGLDQVGSEVCGEGAQVRYGGRGDDHIAQDIHIRLQVRVMYAVNRVYVCMYLCTVCIYVCTYVHTHKYMHVQYVC